MAGQSIMSSAEALPADLAAQLAMPRAAVANRIRECIDRGRELLTAEVDGPEELNSFRANRSKWEDHNRELLRRMFKTDAPRLSYERAGPIPMGASSFRLEMQRQRASVTDKLGLLQSILAQFESPRDAGAAVGARVFVAHAGEPNLARDVAHVLEGMGLVPAFVSAAPAEGEIGLDQLEAYRDARFAVVVVSGDHDGAPPRPDALLLLGYLAARLGRDHVFGLYRSDLPPPGRDLGIAGIGFDTAGAWTAQLMHRLLAPR